MYLPPMGGGLRLISIDRAKVYSLGVIDLSGGVGDMLEYIGLCTTCTPIVKRSTVHKTLLFWLIREAHIVTFFHFFLKLIHCKLNIMRFM